MFFEICLLYDVEHDFIGCEPVLIHQRMIIDFKATLEKPIFLF